VADVFVTSSARELADRPAVTQAIRIRAKARDGLTEVLVLMPHPMETGLRKAGNGEFVPAHFITDVRISVSGRLVLAARMSIAVAQDPLLAFRFKDGKPGERISVSWADNRGEQRTDQSTIT
jgi:sulfur-oxidizing protein SoxZ